MLEYIKLILKYGPGLVELFFEIYDFIESKFKDRTGEQKADRFNKEVARRGVVVDSSVRDEIREKTHQIKSTRKARRALKKKARLERREARKIRRALRKANRGRK